jgi:hypothetical protein
MRRGTIIVIVFILVAGAIVGASQFLRSQPPLEFTVAVNPLAADWVRAAVNNFNASEPVINATQRIQFSVTVVDDLPVWQGSQSWTPENHPAAWIPAASTSVNYFSDRYSVLTSSLARTPLVWGGYASRVNVATNNGAEPLDWESVQRVSAAEAWSAVNGDSRWQFVKLAFGRADQSMSGLAALFTGAAAFSDSANISGVIRGNEFRSWMQPVIASVPNFQTLGADPAAAMARGPSTVEIALLPESQWLLNLNGLTDDEPVIFSYPSYQFLLDFPLAVWNDNSTASANERAAVTALSGWLLRASEQSALAQFGLRPAQGEPTSSAALFAQAVNYGVQLQPDLTRIVEAPPRTEAQGLVQWFTNTVRR